MRYSVEDNSFRRIEDCSDLDNLSKVAGRSLGSLRDAAGHDLWLFPRKGDRYEDKIHDQHIFDIEGERLITGNIMGFIGIGETELTIRSRFSKSSGNDWFMQYVLQKVFKINVFDLDHSRGSESSLYIAAMMFPYFLQKALRQGLYREYIRESYNDSSLRGSIDYNRHIKENYPFKNGRIAYTSRVYRYDNSVTQLVRHTIEFIRTKSALASILYSSSETQIYIKQIVDATPSFRKSDLRRVMHANTRPKIHPFYSEYLPLQRLCLQILRGNKLSYGSVKERIHGVLFDGAWLWEEYLNGVFQLAGFDHPENRTRSGKVPVFSDRDRYYRFPDFIKDNVIADAKYKRLLREKYSTLPDDVSRDDLNQIIMYMHITSSRIGIFVNPVDFKIIDPKTGQYYSEDLYSMRVGRLAGDGGEIYIYGFVIPQECSSYEEFSNFMRSNEDNLLDSLKKIDGLKG